jgi:hypothetical protein
MQCNGTADDEIVSAVLQRVPRSHESLLITGLGPCWTHSRDNQFHLISLPHTQCFDLVRACDEAINLRRRAQGGKPKNLLVHPRIDADFTQRFRIRAGQHRHTEEQHSVCLRGYSRLDHFASAAQMHGQHLHAQLSGRFHGARDRIRNIVKFEIEKNIRAGFFHCGNNFGAKSGVELQADLEK